MQKYWNRHIGLIYKKHITIDDNGFVYGTEKYGWEDIVKIDNIPLSIGLIFFMYPFGFRYSILHLKDGKEIKINGRSIFSKYREYMSTYDVYDELMKIIKKKTIAPNQALKHDG